MEQSGIKWGDKFMLLGEYIHNVDSKGRVSIPSKFKEDLKESFIITKGIDNCLFIYSKDQWNIFEDKLKQLPLTSVNARAFTRLFFSGATEVVIDKTGRVNIPQSLLNYANITKEVAIIGIATRVEIWDKDKWYSYNNSNQNLDEIASCMSELGI